MPIGARRARRFSWCGSSGASVAITTMIEPVSRSQDRSGSRSGISRPTGTPAIMQVLAAAEIALHQHADGVAAVLG